MNIISLFESFVNHLNEICKNNSFLQELERNISNSTNSLNLDVFKNILESLDLEYKSSKKRKNQEKTLDSHLALWFILVSDRRRQDENRKRSQ